MILTLHLDCGMWQILQRQDVRDNNIKLFMEEQLDLPEERFNVIDRSFVMILEDWDKILYHFSITEETNEVRENLMHLAKLIPSLLVE